MNTFFTYELDSALVEKVQVFSMKMQRIFVDQNYDWLQLNKIQNICFAYIEDDSKKIIAYSFIKEYYKSLAVIDFGPVSDNNQSCVALLEDIITYYKKKNYFLIQVKLPYESSSFSDYIRYTIKKSQKFYSSLDQFNWSTIHIDLSQNVEDIEKKIASRHRQSIKKAISAGLEVKEITNENGLKDLISIHKLNYDTRKLKVRSSYFDTTFLQLNDFVLQQNQGFALGVFEKEKMIGGVIFIHEKEYTRYYIGANDFSFAYPILHLAIYEAIKKAKSMNFKYLDMGGYNHVTNDKQVHNVNLFKRGFGGEYIFYPDILYIPLNPFAYQLFRIARYIKLKFDIYV